MLCDYLKAHLDSMITSSGKLHCRYAHLGVSAIVAVNRGVPLITRNALNQIVGDFALLKVLVALVALRNE